MLDVLQNVNYSPTAAFFNTHLCLLWLDGILYDTVLLVMHSCSTLCDKSYEHIANCKMIYVTCLVQWFTLYS